MRLFIRLFFFVAICLAVIGTLGIVYIFHVDEQAKGIVNGTIPFEP
jgi:hypothetical protein